MLVLYGKISEDNISLKKKKKGKKKKDKVNENTNDNVVEAEKTIETPVVRKKEKKKKDDKVKKKDKDSTKYTVVTPSPQDDEKLKSESKKKKKDKLTASENGEIKSKPKKKRKRKNEESEDVSPKPKKQKQDAETNSSEDTNQKTEIPGGKMQKTKNLHVPEVVSENWRKLMSTLTVKKVDKTASKKGPVKKDFMKADKTGPEKEADSDKNIDSDQTPKIWFDGVDEHLIENKPGTQISLITDKSKKDLTDVVAIDCEMVGVGFEGKDSMLARVSIVNKYGNPVYDMFVKPQEKVTDYRTKVSGIRPDSIKNAPTFATVQKEVHKILDGRILVGHAVHHDLAVLYLDHPHKMIRDTSTYSPFRRVSNGRTPSLRLLSDRLLGIQVQQGEHDSIQDAQATMRIYTLHRKEWEKSIQMKKLKARFASKLKNESRGNETVIVSKADEDYDVSVLEVK